MLRYLTEPASPVICKFWLSQQILCSLKNVLGWLPHLCCISGMSVLHNLSFQFIGISPKQVVPKLRILGITWESLKITDARLFPIPNILI